MATGITRKQAMDLISLAAHESYRHYEVGWEEGRDYAEGHAEKNTKRRIAYHEKRRKAAAERLTEYIKSLVEGSWK